MRGRQWSLACGHTLGSMHYNCRACQEEYVAAEQAQMIVRPEGEPPLNPEGDPTKPFGGSYRWDFTSRYIDGFRLQLAAEGKDGYDAQMKQYLSAEAARNAEAARYQGFVARYGTGCGVQGAEHLAALASGCGVQGAEHLAALASGRRVQGAEHLAAPRACSADTAASLAAAAAAFGLGGSFRPPSQPPTRASPGPHPSLALFPQAVERSQHAGTTPGPLPPYPPPSRAAGPGSCKPDLGAKIAPIHPPYRRQASGVWVPAANAQGAEHSAASAASSSGSGRREFPEIQQLSDAHPLGKRRKVWVGLPGTDLQTEFSESASSSPSSATPPVGMPKPGSAEWNHGLVELKLEFCRKNCRRGGVPNCSECERRFAGAQSSSEDYFSGGSRASPQSQQRPSASASDGSAGSRILVDLRDQDDSDDEGALLQACLAAEAQSQSREVQGAEHLAALASFRGVQGAEPSAAPATEAHPPGR